MEENNLSHWYKYNDAKRNKNESEANQNIIIESIKLWIENYEQNQKEKYEKTAKYRFLGCLSNLYNLFEDILVLFIVCYAISGWSFIFFNILFPYLIILWIICVLICIYACIDVHE